MAIVADTNARWAADPDQSREIKESVLDFITDTAQTAVPALALISRGKNPNHFKYEWILDYLGAYPATTTDIERRGEGQDASPTAGDDQVMLFNRTSILGTAFSVTHTQQAVAQHGVTDRFAYEAFRRMKKLIRQLNWEIINGTIDVDSNGPNAGSIGNKRKMGGLVQQITTNASFRSQGTPASDAQGTNTAQAGSNFAQSDLLGVLSSVWSKGGTPNGYHTVLADITEKVLLSKTFSTSTPGSSNVYRRSFGVMDEMAIVLPIDRIVTDAGTVEVHLDPAVRDGEILGFDDEYWELNVLRDWEVIKLAKMGHSEKGSVEMEATNSLLAPNTAWRLHSIVE